MSADERNDHSQQSKWGKFACLLLRHSPSTTPASSVKSQWLDCVIQLEFWVQGENRKKRSSWNYKMKPIWMGEGLGNEMARTFIKNRIFPLSKSSLYTETILLTVCNTYIHIEIMLPTAHNTYLHIEIMLLTVCVMVD